MGIADRVAEELRAEDQRQRDDELRRRTAPTLVFKTTVTEPTSTTPTPSPSPRSIKAEISKQLARQLKDRDRLFVDTVAQFVVTRERKLREQLQREDNVIKDQLQRLQGEVVLLREQGDRDRSISKQAAETDRAEREALHRTISALHDQLDLERGLRTLHDEVATARFEIPKVPAVISQLRDETTSARVVADRKIAALERELRATKERFSKARVEQSITSYKLEQHVKEQEAMPRTAVELEVNTSRFTLRDVHPDAVRALRQFAQQVVGYQDNAAVRFMDPAGSA